MIIKFDSITEFDTIVAFDTIIEFETIPIKTINQIDTTYISLSIVNAIYASEYHARYHIVKYFEVL